MGCVNGIEYSTGGKIINLGGFSILENTILKLGGICLHRSFREFNSGPTSCVLCIIVPKSCSIPSRKQNRVAFSTKRIYGTKYGYFVMIRKQNFCTWLNSQHHTIGDVYITDYKNCISRPGCIRSNI